jgi:hypothetical protein
MEPTSRHSNLLSGVMTSRTEEHSRNTQDSTSVPWHLYRIHSEYFMDRTFSQHDLDDAAIFRESIIRLPRDEIVKIVTAIQTVR